MYNMINIIKATLCQIWKLLTEKIPKDLITSKNFFYFFHFVSIRDRCSLNCHDLHKSNHYAGNLKLYSAVCQLHCKKFQQVSRMKHWQVHTVLDSKPEKKKTNNNNNKEINVVSNEL